MFRGKNEDTTIFRFVFTVLGVVALLSPPAFYPAHAETNFPNKPLTCQVVFPAGGPSDTEGRIVIKHARKALGQRIVIVNTAGAGGAAGWNNVPDAPRDGYWLTMYNLPHILAQPIVMKEAVFTKDDFEPIVHFSKDLGVVTVRADSPYKTLEDMIADAKANPDTVTVAHSGRYIGHHLVYLLMEDSMNIKLKGVPFTGAVHSLACLMGGHCRVLSINLSDSLRQGDKVRMLAIASKERHPWAPDVPTFAEKGYPQILMSSDRGIAVPKGVPKERVKILKDAFWKAIQTKEFQADMKRVHSVTLLKRGEDIIPYINETEKRVRDLLIRLGHAKKQK